MDILKKVIVTRSDGLGTRLCAMVNAIDVADRLDLQFKFNWPSSTYDDADKHAITAAHKFFAPSFVNDHFDPDLRSSRYIDILDKTITERMRKQLSQDESKDGFLINHWSSHVKIEGKTINPPDLCGSFEKIRFSDRIQHVVTAAKSLVPPGSVAIHARRGDLVYGAYRTRLFNQKYAPTGIVKAIVARLLEVGKTPIIFSDDDKIKEIIKRDTNALVSSDIRAIDLCTSEELAMFDIAAMISCQSIISTRSGFSVVSTFANGTKLQNISTFHQMCEGRSAILTDIAEHPEDYSDLDKAKSLQFVATQYGPALRDGEYDCLLSEASRLDPLNQAYPHIRASNALEHGDVSAAEKILQKFTIRKFEADGGYSCDLSPGFDYIKIPDNEAVLSAISGPGFPYLKAYTGHFKSDKQEKEELAREAYLNDTESSLLAARYAQTMKDMGKASDAKEFLCSVVDRLSSSAVYEALFDVEQELDTRTKWGRLAVESCHKNKQAAAKLVLALHLSGETKEAASLATSINSEIHSNPSVYYQLAKYYEETKNISVALELAEKALSMRPNRARYINMRARLIESVNATGSSCGQGEPDTQKQVDAPRQVDRDEMRSKHSRAPWYLTLFSALGIRLRRE